MIMRVLILGLLVLLGGCSTTPVDREGATIKSIIVVSTVATAYCEDGFSKFSESRRSYRFTCRDGTEFNIQKAM